MMSEKSETNERRSKREEGLMNIGSPFVPMSQPPKLVKPGKRALHDPAHVPEAASVRRSLFGEVRCDPTFAQRPAPVAGVVGAVAIQLVGPASGPARFASDRRDLL